MATSRDLLPQWLLHHDSATANGEKSSSSSSSPSLAPPSHITMVPWDDGFTPSGCNGKIGKIVRDQLRSTPSAFHVVDRAVSRETADLLYESAVKAKVWGVYVPTTELSLSKQSQAFNAPSGPAADAPTSTADKEESYRRSLAKRAVQELLVNKAASVISSSDWGNTHGVAVWVIASDCNDETEYHLDYAEMVRYETNVIVPPLYGATLHVSPLRNRVVSSSSSIFTEADTDNQDQDVNDDDDGVSTFEGGGFHVNVNGLEHYKQYGYKTRLAQKLTTDALEVVSASESGWQHVSYLYRRGIICDGEFPHFSGRVRSLPAKETTRVSGELPVKRVVVGFNLFPPEIGAFVQKFPEHSNAFNKYIKLSQAAVKKTGGGSTGVDGTAGAGVAGTQQAWSLESLKKNPKQAAFLKFLAKKMKEKNVDMAALTRGVGGGGPDVGAGTVAVEQASTAAS